MYSETNLPSGTSFASSPVDSPGTSSSPAAFSVLFLDDEPSIVNALYRLFRAEGYTLHRATRGSEALDILGREPVDLIISDMRMPEMDGAEFFAQVAETYPSTVRILLTGYADMQSTIKAINEGKLHRYCTKPWNDDDIKMLVRQALDAKHMREEKQRLLELTQSQHEEIVALNASLEDKVKRRTSELARANEETHEGFKASIEVFANLTELREQGNPGHSRRVAKRTRKLANAMNLDSKTVETVYLGALLHDLGKIGLSDRLIATSENKLSVNERREFQKHAQIGHASLLAFVPLHDAAEIIRSHHERYDGKGYPDQLAGEEIPVGARILAVADAFDSFLVGNESRKPMTHAEALGQIERQAGKNFDPAVIEALAQMVSETGDDGEIAQSATRLKMVDLREGMVTADDLYNEDGVLLLPAAYRLTKAIIDRMRKCSSFKGDSAVISVETQSILAPEEVEAEEPEVCAEG